jgi:hypothetical protein
MTKMAFCKVCEVEREFSHRHDTAHGMPGTHMVGTERFQCLTCQTTFFAADGAPPPLKFILDVPRPQ